jgi:hypothetical protein
MLPSSDLCCTDQCWFISTMMIRFKSIYCMWSLLLNDDTSSWSSYLLSDLYVGSVGHVTTLTHLVVIPDYTESVRFKQTTADSKQTQTTRFRWRKWLRLSRIKRYMKTKSKETWWQYLRRKRSSASTVFDHLR